MKLFVVICSALSCSPSFALTSIASIDGNVDKAWWRANNYETQREADEAALEGCRSEARRNGISALAKKCKISMRAKQPGYGAIVCGDGGCFWVTGHESGQVAIDAAYKGCSSSYKGCREKDIGFWEDLAGFKTASNTRGPKNCSPPTKRYTCEQSCQNTSCTVRFNNGCSMKVVVGQHQEMKWGFNPITGKHENHWQWVNDDACKVAAGY